MYKEQVTQVVTLTPQLDIKSILNMKRRLIKEELLQPLTQADLTRMMNLGCFDNIPWFTYRKGDNPGKDPSGNPVIFGQNKTGEDIIFYNNGAIGKILKDGKMETKKWDPQKFCPAFYDRGFAQGQDQNRLTKSQIELLQSLISGDEDYTYNLPPKESIKSYTPLTVKQVKEQFPEWATNIATTFTDENQVILYVKTNAMLQNKENVRKQVLKNYIEINGFDKDAINCEDAYANKDQYQSIVSLGEIDELKKYFNPSYCIVKSKTINYSSGGFGKYLKDSASIFQTAANPNKKDCKTAIESYFNAMRQNYPQNEYQLQGIKQFIKGCSVSNLRFRGPIENKLNVILLSNVKLSGAYGLKENTLEKTIKNVLLEYHNKKKSLLVETKIVNNRFNLILEDIGKRPNKKKIFDRLINEIIILKNNGIQNHVISEQLGGFFDVVKSFFGGEKAGKNVMGGLGGTFVEYAVKYLMNAIGLSTDSAVGRLFVTAVGNVGSFENIPRILTECDFTAELLSKSIVEAMAGSFIDNNIGAGFLADAIRNVLTDVAFNKDIVKAFQSKISDKVCEILGTLSSKAGDKVKEMKDKALS